LVNALVWAADANGQVWMSQKQLGARVGRSERSVQRLMRYLEQYGLVTTYATTVNYKGLKVSTGRGAVGGRRLASIYQLNIGGQTLPNVERWTTDQTPAVSTPTLSPDEAIPATVTATKSAPNQIRHSADPQGLPPDGDRVEISTDVRSGSDMVTEHIKRYNKNKSSTADSSTPLTPVRAESGVPENQHSRTRHSGEIVRSSETSGGIGAGGGGLQCDAAFTERDTTLQGRLRARLCEALPGMNDHAVVKCAAALSTHPFDAVGKLEEILERSSAGGISNPPGYVRSAITRELLNPSPVKASRATPSVSRGGLAAASTSGLTPDALPSEGSYWDAVNIDGGSGRGHERYGVPLDPFDVVGDLERREREAARLYADLTGLVAA
jgi:DNA-binding Lrp family transcriptional regulator